jgi:SAM-dependent methyltransferase
MTDFSTVTETWGLPATHEQLAMQYCRYRLAGDMGEGRAILEIGCGSGMGLAYLRQRAARVVGGDYTQALLDEARAHLERAPVARFDAQALPFPDASFDVVLMLEMVYYIPDLDRALAEARRVLKPGGSLLVTVPNPDRPDFNPSPFSVAYPNAPDLARRLRAAGFLPKVFGMFPIAAESSRDRMLGPVRHLAIRFHLIPRSMRLKSVVKRLLYGPLPRLGAVREGMADYRPPEALDGERPTARYKTLYAVGSLA